MVRPLILCLACLIWTGPLAAQEAKPAASADAVSPVDAPRTMTMAEVEQAWAQGDFVAVRAGLRHLAETEGTALAQYRYGQVLLEGRGGPVDIAGAVRWLEGAVARDHMAAAVMLARIYLSESEGGPARDVARAADLLQSAAARGDRVGQFYLGQLYMAGEGVAQDEKQAADWFRAAADQGYAAAQFELGRMYARGSGVTQDNEIAFRWLNEAAAGGHVGAQLALAQAYDSGQGVRQDQQAAVLWYLRAAEGGAAAAQRALGMKYIQGDGVAENIDEGLRWLQSAAQAGDVGAMSNIGYLFATGTGVPLDETRATLWYERAADRGLGRAMLALASFREAGRGGPQDINEAVDLYRMALATDAAEIATIRLGRLVGAGALNDAVFPLDEQTPWAYAAARAGDAQATEWLALRAAQGLTSATTSLALVYLNDSDRVAEGLGLLSDAARAGSPTAQVLLGERHMTGEGVALDYVQAHKWFNIAAALGHPQASDLRETASVLMTPDDVAAAQAAARTWFAEEQPQPPTPAQNQQVSE